MALELAIITAWQGESYRRQKRLPKLDKELAKLRQRPRAEYDSQKLKEDWQKLQTMFPEPE